MNKRHLMYRETVSGFPFTVVEGTHPPLPELFHTEFRRHTNQLSVINFQWAIRLLVAAVEETRRQEKLNLQSSARRGITRVPHGPLFSLPHTATLAPFLRQ
jgi:hypothetical protein